MLLQTTATHASTTALVPGRCTGLRQRAACFFQGFLAFTAYFACAASYGFFIAASRCYSALFQPAGLTWQSSGLAYGHPLTFIR
jgi:hypothetical protein